MSIIDTHLHIWNLQKVNYSWLTPDLGVLFQNYEIPEIAKQMPEAGVSKAVLVQAANSAEDTAFMFESAEKYECVAGVVAWLPLLQPAQTALFVEKYKKNPYFKGVRHLIHDEPNPRWLLQAQVLESLKILADNHIPFDVVGILTEHLECVNEIGEKLPHLKMVLDHLNHPRGVLSNKIMNDWQIALREVSSNPNVFAKISGLGTAVTRSAEKLSAEDVKFAIDFALHTFGAEKCLVGGDYPVSLLAENYVLTWKTYQTVLNNMLNEAERAKVYWENAEKFYNLQLQK